ncbi:hypothetical protein ACFV1C_09885 [Streptomyces sp. NPDC059605]
MTRAPLSIATGAMPTPVHVALMLTALRLARKGEGGRTVARITRGSASRP